MDLKTKIKYWCNINEKKAYHLAGLCGVHHSIIYRYLSGKDILHETAVKIDAFINKDLSE